MDSDDARQEVILVVRPIPQDPVEGLRGIFAAVGSVMGDSSGGADGGGSAARPVFGQVDDVAQCEAAVVGDRGEHVRVGEAAEARFGEERHWTPCFRLAAMKSSRSPSSTRCVSPTS